MATLQHKTPGAAKNAQSVGNKGEEHCGRNDGAKRHEGNEGVAWSNGWGKGE